MSRCRPAAKNDALSQRRFLGCFLLLLSWLSCATPSLAQSPALQPTFWKQPLFYVPYKVVQPQTLINRISKVQLMFSRTGANDWTVLEEALPNVQGFSYHAPQDGEYWFALRHLDRRGQPWPSSQVNPQMRVIVDTTAPVLKLSGNWNASLALVFRYESSDVNLDPSTLKIEARNEGQESWSPVALGEFDLVQTDRVVGRASWASADDAGRVQVRATIVDRAGHQASAAESITSSGPSLDFPSDKPTIEKPTTTDSLARTDPFLSSPTQQQRPSHDWPLSNQTIEPQQVNLSHPSQRGVANVAPPMENPYTPARIAAQLVGDRANRAPQANSPDSLQDMQESASLFAPPLVQQQPTSGDSPPLADTWSAAASENDSSTRLVNSQTFELEYDLQQVGPWGVSRVELWGSHDNGQTWQSFGVDPDGRSPLRVTVDGEGTLGFLIRVDSASGVGAPSPRAGTTPELYVQIDLQPPKVALESAVPGAGSFSDHLQLRWRAQDSNLSPRPIGLYFSSSPAGPWSTIATGLENSGSYTWRVERHVPERFYLRVEARDTAGNVSSFVSPDPMLLQRPQPMGRLRGVRPVGT